MYLNQPGEPLFILWRTTPASWVLKVQIQTIKSVQPEKVHGCSDELIPVRRGGQHGSHLGSPEVPASNSQQRGEAWVGVLQVVETLVPIQSK